MHILLIEDETFLAKVLSNTLTKADYKVTCIEDGLQAWEHLQQNRTTYDLILMDRGLPGMDGLSLLKNIKQESDLAQIPVVIETGMDDGDSVQEGLSAGAYYYLTKPVHHQLLLTVIESALNEYHQNQEMQEAILDAQNTLEFLEHGYFSCQTLEQSKQLAKVLAKAFPEPQKAILGLSELLINAVEHGNLAISYDEKTKMMMDGTLHDEIKKRLSHPLYQNRRVRIELTKKTEMISVTIVDEGEGFDWGDYLEFSAERAFDPHGRGIAMANKTSFDFLKYQGKGNIVTVGINISKP